MPHALKFGVEILHLKLCYLGFSSIHYHFSKFEGKEGREEKIIRFTLSSGRENLHNTYTWRGLLENMSQYEDEMMNCCSARQVVRTSGERQQGEL